MYLYDFPPIAALLMGADWLLTQLSALLTPLAGANAAALAVIVMTLLVRTVLIPVGRSQARATAVRQRLAPRIADLQRRHPKDRRRLGTELAALYASENSSPFAGIGPALAQAPVLMAVYGLFVVPTIGGHPNLLLTHTLMGVPLSTTLLTTLTSGGATIAAVTVPAAAMATIALVAQLSRRLLAVAPPAGPGAPAPATARVLSYLPFLTVGVAAIVPLAAALYLATTTTWTLVERLVLNHLYGIGTPPQV